MSDVCVLVGCILTAMQICVSVAWFAFDIYTVKRNDRRHKDGNH